MTGPIAALSKRELQSQVLLGIEAGRPAIGPLTVHVDVTNSCNTRCLSCWDHSPLLTEPRPADWKRRRMALADYCELCDSLAALGSLRSLVLSGQGEPLTHPDIYEMIARARSQRWQVTLITNLIAADIERLEASRVDRLLVGVHGVTPASYAELHPGWGEREFFDLCRYLRRLQRAGLVFRHVHAIQRGNADQLLAMVRFGKSFRAERVSFKLASLAGGTEACAILPEQCDRLLAGEIEQARRVAGELGVATNLDLFEQQVRAASVDPGATAAIDQVGCYMGYLYARVTVEKEVLYCCNPAIPVGSLAADDFAGLWSGGAWQAVRDRLRQGRYFPGCERCGKLEQNLEWRDRVGRHRSREAG